MRILVTVPWGQRLGGAEAMLHAILEGAAGGPHELELVFFEPGPWPDELRDAGWRVDVLPAGRLRHGHRFVATVARLASLLRRRRPEVILNWVSKAQLYGSPAAVLAGMADRVVWWQHSIPQRTRLDLLATRLPAAAIGCDSEVAARAQAKLPPRRRILEVAPGVPLPRAEERRAPLELPSGLPIVGMVGRLQPGKRQAELLRAQAILHERGHELHMLIVGGDSYGLSPEYAASLPPLIARLGLGDAVTLTGEVPDAGPYIKRMDVLVNASDVEAFGLVLLEGMARGVPVVAVDSGAPPEFIEDRKTGILARSSEPAALADALETALCSPELREAIGKAGRERFMQEFTVEAVCDRLFAQLETVRARRPPG